MIQIEAAGVSWMCVGSLAFCLAAKSFLVLTRERHPPLGPTLFHHTSTKTEITCPLPTLDRT